MAFFARVTFTGDNSTTNFAVTFAPNFIAESDIEVFVNTIQVSPPTFSFDSGLNQIVFVTAPATGDIILIKRNTNRATKEVDFLNTASLLESDLNLAETQNLFIDQEVTDEATQDRLDNAASVVSLTAEIALAEQRSKDFAQQLIDGNAPASQTVNDLIVSLIDPVSDQVDEFADDTKITPLEKQRAKLAFDLASAQNTDLITQATAFGIETETAATDFTTAFDDLNTFLNTTLNVFADFTTTTSGVTRSTWNSKWNVFDVKRELLINALYTEAKNFSDTAQGVADSASTAVNNIGSDTIITKQEKRWINREFARITQNKIDLVAQATSFGITTEKDNYETSFNTLNTFLTVTLDLFGDLNADTTIVRATWDTNWNNYYIDERVLVNKLADVNDAAATASQDSADGAITSLTDIGADSVVTAGAEKLISNQEFDTIVSEQATLQSRADAFSVSRVAFDAAFTVLSDFLLTTLVNFQNVAVDTTINRATWNTNWQAYFDARLALIDLFDNETITAQTSAATNKSILDNITVDTVVSKGAEKFRANELYDNIVNEKVTILARAASVGVSSVAFLASFDFLTAYLNGLTDFFDNTKDTTIVKNDWDTAWQSYYQSKEELLTAITDKLMTDFTGTLASVNDLVEDGIVDPNEKVIIQQTFQRITNAVDGEEVLLTAQADALTPPVSTVAYDAAFLALTTYINTTLLLFNDLTVSTNLTTQGSSRTEWRTIWNNYFAAETNLRLAISVAGNTTFDAHIANVSNPHVVTAAQSGALPLTGGTLTGNLNVTAGGAKIISNSTSSFSEFVLQEGGVQKGSLASNTNGWTDVNAADANVALGLLNKKIIGLKDPDAGAQEAVTAKYLENAFKGTVLHGSTTTNNTAINLDMVPGDNRVFVAATIFYKVTMSDRVRLTGEATVFAHRLVGDTTKIRTWVMVHKVNEGRSTGTDDGGFDGGEVLELVSGTANNIVATLSGVQIVTMTASTAADADIMALTLNVSTGTVSNITVAAILWGTGNV